MYYNESWKKVKIDYPLKFRYAITDYGRFISFTNHPKDGRLLKCSSIEEYKYFSYIERRKKEKLFKRLYLHRLVAENFLPKPKDNQTFVLHLDYNNSNNHFSNLRWATRQEMLEHRRKSPLIIKAIEYRKSKGIGPKLTSTKVKLLKRKINDPNRKTRMKMIAKQFGISEMQLYRIKSGENWSDINPD